MMTPWLIIWISAPSTPNTFCEKMPKPMKPRWLIEA